MTSVLDRALNSAREFVKEIHPEAAASALAGSIALGCGTRTSDLDIVVYYDDRPASFAETLRYDGWLVESFVYGPEGIDEWFAFEAKERRPVALDMWSIGIPLADNIATVNLKARAQALIAAGPEPISEIQHADLRYGLTAAIDDLEGNPELGEEFAIMADVYKRAAELLLLNNSNWLGTGKWLVRRLATLQDPNAHSLVQWVQSVPRSPQELCRIAHEVLESIGGQLREGHTRGSTGTRL
ncbi:nucleotidyltransferase domain-containing protein [Arthrobacter sp. FW306-2-2C-D06B]|uniref:nucleotidyltransferase domain-containing protein n=1 Tax=Arthrobacter sp. FW306-2-2C-D06B TaxID=2879618 RepID=UPI001F3C44AB|nr:nucleotidyltransferase domain-containing protein [Arthrobacter sp. FW306-2-2C-D06B]UKA56927.1 nucleotidyltransferase domain-containing protein [Arthrobacter sp. FW306-2-2C-D06B]